MKKTLILSILMSFILLISSLTAIYAWYTANNTAIANGAKITVSTAYEPLRVSTVSSAGFNRTIDLSGMFSGNVLKPTAPKSRVTTADARFVCADVNVDTGLTEVSTENYVIKSTTFYLKNTTTEELSVTLNVLLSGDLAGKLAWVLILDGVNYAILTNGYNTVTVSNGLAETGTPVTASNLYLYSK